MKKWFLSTSVITFTLLLASPAMSANITFRDLFETGTVVETADFDVSPAVVTHGNFFNGEDDVEVTGSFYTNSAAGLSGSSVGALFEPGMPPGTVSDFVTTQWSTRDDPAGGPFRIADVIIRFGSDPASCENIVCATLPLNQGILEDGTTQLMNSVLSLPENITVYAQSDVSEVPEPTSLLLLAGGLIAGARGWRKSQTNG